MSWWCHTGWLTSKFPGTDITSAFSIMSPSCQPVKYRCHESEMTCAVYIKCWKRLQTSKINQKRSIKNLMFRIAVARCKKCNCYLEEIFVPDLTYTNPLYSGWFHHVKYYFHQTVRMGYINELLNALYILMPFQCSFDNNATILFDTLYCIAYFFHILLVNRF